MSQSLVQVEPLNQAHIPDLHALIHGDDIEDRRSDIPIYTRYHSMSDLYQALEGGSLNPFWEKYALSVGGAVVGFSELVPDVYDGSSYDIRYIWVGEEHRQRGYGKEALKTIVNGVFDRPETRTVTTSAAVNNLPGIKTALAAGFLITSDTDNRFFFTHKKSNSVEPTLEEIPPTDGPRA